MVDVTEDLFTAVYYIVCRLQFFCYDPHTGLFKVTDSHVYNKRVVISHTQRGCYKLQIGSDVCPIE